MEEKMKVDPKEKKRTIFIKNFIGGLGWAAGTTVGFGLLIALIGLILKWLGGLPLVGNFFANLIEVTNEALKTKGVLP